MKLPPEILYWLGIFAIMMIGAVSCEQRERHRWSVMLLTLGGFFVYLAAARLMPYLNPWDELFHAQVAKNCMEHPFAPMLYDSNIVPNHNYGIWTCSHIWLHKQPLFIWQIALSFKIFGVSELSLRLPSVILCTLMIPLCYRMAFLLTQRRDTAFFTALCAACSWFLFRLTSGIQSTDHNDVSFIFFITASIWAFCEYIHSDRKAGWAALVGILAGAAVLTKWLAGLLVFGVWGLYLLTEHKFYIKDWKFKHLLLAFFVMLLIALPWQLYILQRFPEMAQQELLYNFKHINDYYGHAIGDALLVELSKRLGHALRETDILSRISGDEFLLLLNPISSNDEVAEFIHVMQERLKAPFFIEESEIFAST